MPHSLSPLVIAAPIAQIVGLLFVAAVMLGVQQAFPRAHTRAWGLAWLAGSVWVGAGTLRAIMVGGPTTLGWVLAFLLVLGMYLQAAWLVLGTRLLRQGPVDRRLWAASVALPLLLAAGSTALGTAVAARGLAIVVRSGLPLAVLGVAALWTASWVWRSAPGGSVGTRLTAGALGLWGVCRLQEVADQALFLAGVWTPAYLVYCGFVDLAILIALGLGTVVWLLEEERDLLLTAQQKFALVFQNSPDPIVVTLPDEGGRIVDVNQRFVDLFGRPPEEVRGRTTVELGLFPSESAREAFAADLVVGGTVHSRELEVDVGDVPRTFAVSAGTFASEGRTHAVGIARDITERARAEERLRRSEERLRLALDAAGMGTWEWDLTSGVVAWSEEAERILRVTPGGGPRSLAAYLEMVHPADRAEVEGRLGPALDGECEGFQHEHRILTPDGATRWIEGRGRMDRDAAGRPRRLRGIVTDVTRRKEAEHALRESEEQLRRSRVMEAMGGLVAGVAHEVRNPLFSISANVDAVHARLGDDRRFTRQVAELRAQVGRLTRLMQDLIDYGRPASLQRSSTRIDDVARRAVAGCARLAAERQVRVDVAAGGDLPPLLVDARRLEQVFENLVANAVQHAPAGSTVVVRASLYRVSERTCVLCTVEDEGPGVPVDIRAHVFEPFVSHRNDGTGLGLSIVQRVVEAHGGTVAVADRKGGGARFEVRLPVSEDDAASPAPGVSGL
jgi:PAS domain S-box-containing protein